MLIDCSQTTMAAPPALAGEPEGRRAARPGSKEPEARGRATRDVAAQSWRDSNVLVNTITIALVACLVPARPFSASQLHLTLATWAFVTAAVVNHLVPERWPRLTHVVKAAYTQLLFASVAPAAGLGGRWWLAAVAVSVVDLVPLVAGRRAGGVAESAGAAVRLGAVAWGFWLLRFPWWLAAVYLACSALYFVERRRRIARGRRFEYGWLHGFEHIAVWLFLDTLNAPRLDRALVGPLLGGVVGSGALFLVGLGVATNVRLRRSLERDLPPWFDASLRDLLEQKSRANLRSHRLENYVFKPLSPKILNRRVSWADIEAMIARIRVPVAFDTVVGVASGGAFIARGVANRIGVSKVRYVRSRLWSGGTVCRTLATSLRYYAGLRNATGPRFDDEGIDLRGERVLVVDDSVCTGATIASVVALCRERGAAHVETFALFASPDHPTHYHGQLSKTPLVWPWGWEAD